MFLDVYIDESSQTQCRFLLLGGTVLPTAAVATATQAIMDLKAPELTHGEMKWGKVSKAKLPAYIRLVDSFFDNPALSEAHFHSIVVDTSRLNHRLFNQGSSEVGFNKEIYQLATKCARLYTTQCFNVYLDQRETPQHPNDLRTILNMGRKKAGDRRDWPFRRCQFRDSKKTPLLWISDILSGALAFHLNGHRAKDGASPARCTLSDYILHRAGVPRPQADTAMSGKFTVWHRQLQ